MKNITNHDLIAKRKRLANILAPIAMLALVAGLIMNVLSLDDETINLPYFYAILGLLAVGFILSTISSSLVNRWVREPRPDQALNRVLKKFNNKHILLHYTNPAPHVFIAQNTVYAITTKHVDGAISVKNNRWRRKFTFMRLLRFFAEEGLGSPTVEAEHNLDRLKGVLEDKLPEDSDVLKRVPIEPLIVFTHPKAKLKVDGSRVEALLVTDLKNYVRKHTQGAAIKAEDREALLTALAGDLTAESVPAEDEDE